MNYNFSCPEIGAYSTTYYFQTNDATQSARIFPHHVHDQIEFYILLEGDVSFAIESSIYKMSAGDAVVMKPNEMHNCILNSSSQHKHICFWFDPTCEFIFGDFLRHEFGKNNLISPTPENKARLFTIYQEMQSATKENDKHKLFYLSLEMLDLFRKSLSANAETKTLPHSFKQVLNEIDENFKTISSVSQLAKKFFISQSTLVRLFRTHLHTTPKQYIESKRLAYSRRLLKNGASVTYACLEAGFSDCSNFIRLFKKRYLVTPRQYRSQ